MIHVNDQSINIESNVPFDGEKFSGIGCYSGEWALEEFTTVKWVSVQKGLVNTHFLKFSILTKTVNKTMFKLTPIYSEKYVTN